MPITIETKLPAALCRETQDVIILRFMEEIGNDNNIIARPATNCLMLELIAVLVVVLWLLGMITSFTLGGLIHILLVIAVIAVLLRLISGRRI